MKKTVYNPRRLIATVLSSVEEPYEFANITGKSYTHSQAINISYDILHQTGKFGLAICQWNCMPAVQKTWVSFKPFFFDVSQRAARDV